MFRGSVLASVPTSAPCGVRVASPCSVAQARSKRAQAPRIPLLVVASSGEPSPTNKAKVFLERCTKLVSVRFIVVGDGAILESVSQFSSIKYTDTPTRGVLATISNDDKSFECHLVLNKLKQAKIAKSKARNGDFDVYAVRFLEDGGKMALSCLLHGNSGSYSPDSVAAWNDLHSDYGEVVEFCA